MKTNRNKEKYYLGKCDGYGNGRKSCPAYLTWELKDGCFSAQAEVWQANHNDIIMGGQCLEEVCAMFPDDQKAQAILKVWREWHLNGTTPGSPKQMEWIKAHEQEYRKSTDDHYSWAIKGLTEAGLEPDMYYIHNGKPYSYGSAWLMRELPPEIVAEIKSWSST